MISTAAAIIGSAVLGAGSTMLASSNAAKAAQTQGDLQYKASQDSIAEQKRQFDAIQANNAPFRNAGVSALQAIGGSFGLPGYSSTPSMTSPVASTPVPNPGGVSMTGGQSIQVPSGGTGKTGDGVSVDPASAGPSMTASGAPNQTASADAYLAANPDVQARAQQAVASGEIGPNSQWKTPEDWAAFQYQNTGQSEGRAWPTVSMTNPAPATGSGGYVAPAGYSDPTAPNGYGTGARPDPGAAPTRPDIGPLNVGLDQYQQSLDYNFRLQQGQNALDHVASSMSGVMSGARVKAADRYNQDYATTDYNNWRDYTTNQYNTNRNVSNSNYGVDLSQYDATRARSDGLYADDRAFSTGRYDTRNSQLMSLAGFGQNSTNATNAAGQSFAQSQSNLTMAGAQAQGNAAINSANAFTSGVNNLVTTGAYLGGKAMTGGYGVTPSTPSVWSGGSSATPSFAYPTASMLSGPW